MFDKLVMRQVRGVGWVAAALLATSCASSPLVAPSPVAPSISVRDELKAYFERQAQVESAGAPDEETLDERSLAVRRTGMARFRELTRCGDPVEEDRAYGAWALLLANLENAGLVESVGREAMPVFREWVERYPDSDELGQCLWMLTDTAPDAENDKVLRFLEGLSGSAADGVARGAHIARAGLLDYLDRKGEAAPLLEEVVRRWPDSFEARNARRDLRGMSLTPGVEAPAFSLRDLQGREVSLASLRGRVALLVFFSFG